MKNTSMILCVSENWCIGDKNRLLFNIKTDLDMFKLITSGHTIVMGRNTYESLPFILPNRKYIVLSRDKDYKIDEKINGFVMTLEDFIAYSEVNDDRKFIIGGAQIYNSLGPKVEDIYLTVVHKVVKGDAYVNIGDILTDFTNITKTKPNIENGLNYHFEKWQRKK